MDREIFRYFVSSVFNMLSKLNSFKIGTPWQTQLNRSGWTACLLSDWLCVESLPCCKDGHEHQPQPAISLKRGGLMQVVMFGIFLQCHQGHTKHQPHPLSLFSAFGTIFLQNPASIVVATSSHQAYVGKLAQNEDSSRPFGRTLRIAWARGQPGLSNTFLLTLIQQLFLGFCNNWMPQRKSWRHKL